MSTVIPDDTTALLTRLSQKPGVQSTLVLSRNTGAIVRTTGLVSTSSEANNDSTLPSSSSVDRGYGNGTRMGGLHSAEEMAGLVWDFVKAAGGFAKGMDGDEEVEGEDEQEGSKGKGDGDDGLRLLRVRLRRNEVVIVPDKKFLLVVVHQTPPA